MTDFLKKPYIPIAFLLCLVGIHTAFTTRTGRTLPSDAYIWQRQWTPAVSTAVTASQPVIHTWRILAAELDGHGSWVDTTPDSPLLARTHTPVIAVIRIEGQLADWDEEQLAAHILAVKAAWQQRGITVSGLEIDHDCATVRLPAYARFLGLLHGRLEPTPLSITVLPTWLASPELEEVLARVDDAVLQIHAVQNPQFGLFNPEKAHEWVRTFAQRRRGPWHVALPAYGTRVTWGTDGRIAGIESEQDRLMGADSGHELVAPPAEIAAFMKRIEHAPPHGLAGWAWFRLPTSDDRRAWSLPTWRAVITHQPLRTALSVSLHRPSATAPYDIVLANAGNADAEAPPAIRIESPCPSGADGLNGYNLDYDAQGMWLRRAQPGLLRAGQQAVIGWVRCDRGTVRAYAGTHDRQS
ncbi:hypothetical protein GLI01_25450 [Gluconacetobacter liquefaciens]|uniref:DUF3142 domain-containing protein n=1 Tax=Gluconacetobacter liquefaciens TaxID=89584 RepID=A0A370FYU5_GLULI|nr:DUF3142 domain-containing protein [Gluconacetobacter liquefaciens]MBB2188118.1 DUF3142 domain-containing protein [Gluconacetobacter liquefaciens]RDI36100.1 uncharacterized protein DUF3142 [Gluconacetobacter liquefaciens]GEB38510.1 hypothetical protein GLI01_25450 [Gluconacetobacter liquefaciens]